MGAVEAQARLAELTGGGTGRMICEAGEALCELRVRAGQRTRLILTDGSERCADAVSAQDLRMLVRRLCGDSLYACEEELRQGWFSSAGGLRVGVCGRLGRAQDGRLNMSDFSSICVRMPREKRGCARGLLEQGLESLLILSPPGLGKTTLLRELARKASQAGWNVAVADERRELAACFDGVPGFDLGERTDVMDGCNKAEAIPMLVRACCPDLIIADEIGGDGDAQAILDAMRCGVRVAASAHAAGFEAAWKRLGTWIEAFDRLVLLGPKRGQIREIRAAGGQAGP